MDTRGAEEGGIPYGAPCGLCGDYGYCPQLPSPGKASRFLASFYAGKGLKTVVKKSGRRFMEAEIYREDVLIDKVLLDMRTGRIRSIF